MKALVIANNLLRVNSPASSIEMGLFDGISNNDINITAYCSSLGSLKPISDKYKTIVVSEKNYWGYIYRIIRHVFPDILNIPDYHYFSWGKRTEKLARKLIEEERFDYIHSFSHPCSCHLVAYHLHKKSGLPWIASFFDSWIDYPSLKYYIPAFRKYNEKLERIVAENATLIIHNNEGIAKLWRERYGEDIAKKIIVIPLNEKFDEAMELPPLKRNNDVLNISHVGTFYPFRNAQSFIEGVHSFVIRYPKYRDRLRISFVGLTQSTDMAMIDKYQLNDIFNICGRVSGDECEQIYKESDVLLATAQQSFEDFTYPSKIIKYFFYRKPILGIAPPTSVLFSELSKSCHCCIKPEDSTAIGDYIYNAITNYDSICNFDKNYWKMFSLDKVVRQYGDCIRRITIKNLD